MAITNTTALDVTTTGSNTNGGGYDTAAGTTDYSQQNSAQVAVTDIVAVGTTTLTSATAGWTAAMVGNMMYMTGGSGSLTADWYQVVTRTNSTTITVDRSVAAGTGITGNLGGSLASIQTAMNIAWITSTSRVADCIVYVKKGTYTSTVALVNAGMTASQARNRLIGYNTTHGDAPNPSSGNQPVFAVGSGAGVNGITITVGGLMVENMEFDGTATSGSKGNTGINSNVLGGSILNCKIHDFTNEGIIITSNDWIISDNEITACGGTTAACQATGFRLFWSRNYIHKNTKSGLALTGNNGQVAYNNLITNNSGASSDGIVVSTSTCIIVRNTIYGNGRDGIHWQSASTTGGLIQENILAKNAGWGLNMTFSMVTKDVSSWNYNGYYGNTSGTNTGYTASSNDVSVSINPFNSSDVNLAAETSPDWGLNNTASAGASLRGISRTLNGLTTSTSYHDIGAFQHQDSGGGGGTTILPWVI